MHDAYPRLFEPAHDRRPAQPAAPRRAPPTSRSRAPPPSASRARTAPRPPTVRFPDGDTFAPVRIRVAASRERLRGPPQRRAPHGSPCTRPPRPSSAPAQPSRGRRRRLRRPARLPPGQADAARRRAGVRSHGARRARRRRRAADHQRLPLRRRAGRAVRAPPGPEVGRATRHVAAPLRHRARPRPGGGLRLARAHARRASTSSSATRGSPGTTASRSTPRSARRTAGDGARERACRPSCPTSTRRCSPRAAQRWNVSAALLAAQLYAESNFNPFAQSGAGAQGIAQFMPGTARALGLDDPFDAEQAIDAQAHLMRDLLRRFARGAARARRLQRGPGAGRRAACACRRTRRRAATSRGSSACSAAPATPRPADWRCALST